jgi:predicted DNA-binding transcriptional regulator AlpA
MRTSNNALRITTPTAPQVHELKQPTVATQPVPNNGQPRLVPAADGDNGNGHHKEHPLRMYTEEQVAEMLQVSLSQLRKWRMKQHEGHRQGPPFRKIGRLVRYPEGALRAYINGEQQV